MAENDKVRYKKEMTNYSPPSDDDSDDGKSAKKPKAKRAKKDPNAPKRPLVRETMTAAVTLSFVLPVHPADKMNSNVTLYSRTCTCCIPTPSGQKSERRILISPWVIL